MARMKRKRSWNPAQRGGGLHGETTFPAFVKAKLRASEAGSGVSRRQWYRRDIQVVIGAPKSAFLAFRACVRSSPMCRSAPSSRLSQRVEEVPGCTMDARELLGYLFAAASLVLVFVGIWALSYYLRRERRARRARNRRGN